MNKKSSIALRDKKTSRPTAYSVKTCCWAGSEVKPPDCRCGGPDASYLLRALQISITTSTDKAIVLGWGSSNTSQSTPLKRSSCTRHCMWCVYACPAIITTMYIFIILITKFCKTLRSIRQLTCNLVIKPEITQKDRTSHIPKTSNSLSYVGH